MKCSKTFPCYNCSRFSRNCVFVAFEDPQVRASMMGGTKSDDSASHSQMSEDEDTRLYFPQTFTPWGGEPTAAGHAQTPELSPEANEALYDGLIEHQLDALLTQGGGHVPDRPEHGHSGNMLAPAPFQNVISTGIEPSFDTLLATSQAPTAISVDSVIARTELDMLYHQYFKAVDPLAHLLHKPTFDRQFCRVMLGQHPSKTATKSFTALVLAMCFAAAVSLTNSQPQVHFQTNKAALVEKLKLATERALSAAQHMKSLKLVTMQAFTIYLIPQCRGEISRSQTSLVGALVRLAQCAGLHRDASNTDTSPLECHVRSLLWYQICFLDLHTCEAQGPQPMIHDDDFDTPLPANVNDLAFDVATVPVPSTDWTDVTFSLLRFEITEVHKSIFRERMSLNRKATDLSTVRSNLDSRVQAIKSKYLDHLDDQIPIQRCAKLTATSLLSRCTPMLLQIFFNLDDFSDMQRQLQHDILTSSLDLMEASATLETATDLAVWAWYAPTYQQYHSIFIPLVLLYTDMVPPANLPDADRASAMINHVFGTCYGISRQQRCGDILRMLASECSAFMKLRKVKCMPPLSSRSPRSSEVSSPDVERAFANLRREQQQQQQQQQQQSSGGPLEVVAAASGANANQGTLAADTEALSGFLNDGSDAASMSMSMEEWWSLPDHVDFDLTDPMFGFQEGV
ncbi:MAG: hypothetical protein LQ352_005019 [Teloschistes flavicans]|nr:MAG: hypothetical protein LQ352_005019 [Teloschistes flavicans]